MNRFIPYFEFVAFLTSLLAFPVIRKSKYLRLFPVLLLVIVSVEVYQLFWGSKGKINAWIYNILIPLQHLLYLIILRLAVNKKSYKRFLLVSSIVLIAFCVITGFFLEENHFNVNAYCLGSVLIIIGILTKFYEMLQNPADFNFLRIPFFYMLFAFLLFNVGTLPYFAMSNWLYFVTTHKDLLLMMQNGMSVLNYVLYTTYTVMFLWMIQRKGYS
ncbi:hypothetical protein [Ohtaekwangia koreensis]|uniref:Uncharacterized protein n=1 Tax=Ohtaekwangia koreensis TaxID=688867 RepID=A0A1T5K519_9BACT|nr:hypothetical protein [Ohtaekwangia koreensis]SKC58558.1 hypothetical protein SAMN05660236_1811 [Ohtaekwangia koreensis]